MISYISGTIAVKNENNMVVDVGGIGYSIFMPPSEIASAGGIGEAVTVHTYFHVRDEQPELFGFLDRGALVYFNKLIAISGVGPKAALALLGTLSPEDLALAIISEDVKAITRAPGVGTKMAQRIILELKGKIETSDAVQRLGAEGAAPHAALRTDTEAVNALIALGASPSAAQKTVMQIDTASLTVEEIIKEALRRMADGI